MPIGRGGRSAYNPIASSEDDENQQAILVAGVGSEDSSEGIASPSSVPTANGVVAAESALQTVVSMPSSSSTGSDNDNNRRNRHRNYTRISNDGDNASPNNNSSTGGRRQVVPLEATPLKEDPTKGLGDDDDDSDDDSEFDNLGKTTADGTTRIQVVILDSAQKRFHIQNVSPDWTVGKFKRRSAKVHKVPPPQQRLIFRGKMLSEDKNTLRAMKIDQNDLIIHLFPKPRVVVTGSNDTSTVGTVPGDDEVGPSSGAHVPSIVIDQEEQERRGQILVLGSVEIAESQNNVKMLSLLLLVICFMRLLALFSVAMGVAEEPVYDDDGRHNSTASPASSPSSHSNPRDPYDNNPEMEVREWQNSDYFDLVVSAIGFFVATLGMKATHENTSRLATLYWIGTIIAGIGWNAWNVFEYVEFYQEQTEPSKDDDVTPLTRDDFITVAFFTVAMPLMVWGVCCARAWEFRRLIEDAENEAAERIRSQLAISQDEAAAGRGGSNGNYGVNGDRSGRRRGRTRRTGVANDDSGRELTNLSSTEIV